MSPKLFNGKKSNFLQLILILVLSAVLGISVYTYTSGIEQQVKSKQDLETIYIANQQVLTGTTFGDAINQELIEKKEFPIISIPSGAIRQVNSINIGLVALQNIQPGQIILENNFGSYSAKTGTLVIPDGKIAVTITLSETAHVANFIQPGSEVVIFATGQSGKSKVTQIFIPKALIIAIGNQVAANNSQTNADSSSLITLALTPQQAAKLIHGLQGLQLYFGLIGNAVDLSQSYAISDANVLG